jgi:hypothetical protein
VAALTIVLSAIADGGITWLNARFLAGRFTGAENKAAIVVGAVGFLVFLFQGILYAKGRPWVRALFILENGLLIFLGVLWFVKNQVGAEPNRIVALLALVLPMMTLFPLLWPLLSFRPVPPTGGR